MSLVAFPGSSGTECACGHSQSDHEVVRRVDGKEIRSNGPDCQVVVGVDQFCACSGFRTAHVGHPEPGFQARLRRTLADDSMPGWTAWARCRSAELGGIGANRPGMLHPDAYLDDLAGKGEDVRLPESSVEDFMRDACAPCPVRRECLNYAFRIVDWQHVSLEWIPMEDDPDKSEPVWVYEETEAGRRYGIYGGVPGRLREHFKSDEDAANEWFLNLAEQRGWDVADVAMLEVRHG